jgi:hypothetical protein
LQAANPYAQGGTGRRRVDRQGETEWQNRGVVIQGVEYDLRPVKFIPAPRVPGPHPEAAATPAPDALTRYRVAEWMERRFSWRVDQSSAMWSQREVAPEDVRVTRVLFAEDYEIVGSDGFAAEDYATELGATEMVGPQGRRWFCAYYRPPGGVGAARKLEEFMELPY